MHLSSLAWADFSYPDGLCGRRWRTNDVQDKRGKGGGMYEGEEGVGEARFIALTLGGNDLVYIIKGVYGCSGRRAPFIPLASRSFHSSFTFPPYPPLPFYHPYS